MSNDYHFENSKMQNFDSIQNASKHIKVTLIHFLIADITGTPPLNLTKHLICTLIRQSKKEVYTDGSYQELS